MVEYQEALGGEGLEKDTCDKRDLGEHSGGSGREDRCVRRV